MCIVKHLSILALAILLPSSSFCQEEHRHKEGEKEEVEVRHFIGIIFGYTFVPAGDNLESTSAGGKLVPTVGLDYFYAFTHKWEIGLMADLELDHYLIVNKELERENAFILGLVGVYKLNENWGVLAGLGYEWEHNKNLFVLRFGVDRAFWIGKKGWRGGVSFVYDLKEDFDTWSLSIGVGKTF